jgi:hypothetical protein
VLELLLEALELRDVGRVAHEADRAAVGVADHAADVVDVRGRAVGPDHPVLDVVARPAPVPRGEHPLPIVGMHALHPALRVGVELGDRPAPHRLVRLAAEEHALALRIGDPEDRVEMVRDVAEVRLVVVS